VDAGSLKKFIRLLRRHVNQQDTVNSCQSGIATETLIAVGMDRVEIAIRMIGTAEELRTLRTVSRMPVRVVPAARARSEEKLDGRPIGHGVGKTVRRVRLYQRPHIQGDGSISSVAARSGSPAVIKVTRAFASFFFQRRQATGKSAHGICLRSPDLKY